MSKIIIEKQLEEYSHLSKEIHDLLYKYAMKHLSTGEQVDDLYQTVDKILDNSCEEVFTYE